MNNSSTAAAAEYVVFPFCDASTITSPAPVIVKTLPERVAGPEIRAKLTGKPDVDVALRVIGATP